MWVTARRDGRPLTVASSDDRASALDETQYQVGDGPCLLALTTTDPVLIDDVDHDTRWPDYLNRVRPVGLRCSFSLPLMAAGAPVGAMNLYGFGTPHIFTPAVRHRCELFAAHASGAFQLSLSRAADQQLLDQLDQALASRTIIDQALGILIGQQHCTADQAFALLRSRSQNGQQKLRDVAANLITRTSGEPPPARQAFRADLTGHDTLTGWGVNHLSYKPSRAVAAVIATLGAKHVFTLIAPGRTGRSSATTAP